MVRAKVLLKRVSMSERLGIGIAIENNDSENRVISVWVEQVEEGSVAARCGLEVGDRILQVDGVDVEKCTRNECLSLFQHAQLHTSIIILPAQVVEAIDRMRTVDTVNHQKQVEGSEDVKQVEENGTTCLKINDEAFAENTESTQKLDTLDDHKSLNGSIYSETNSNRIKHQPLIHYVGPDNDEYVEEELKFQTDTTSNKLILNSIGKVTENAQNQCLETNGTVDNPSTERAEMKEQDVISAKTADPIIDQRQFEFKSTLALFDDGCDCQPECSSASTHNVRANISRTTSESSGVHSLFSNSTGHENGTTTNSGYTSTSSPQRLLSAYDKEVGPTSAQLSRILQYLGRDANAYKIFGVTLHRPHTYDSGSVGLLLSKQPKTDYTIVKSVTSSSIADKNGRIYPYDLVFYINDQFTGDVHINDARDWLKARALQVDLVVGRKFRQSFIH
ncbi:PDZ domain-containing protein [Aphelenchoides bicaudatus]|nr:PDZ domain-containing protein [Aphelenchoides bicaudatus]